MQTSQDSWTSPNAMFIMVIMGIFLLAGLLHPEEFFCLVPGNANTCINIPHTSTAVDVANWLQQVSKFKFIGAL